MPENFQFDVFLKRDAAASHPTLAEEDGYKFRLRYALPDDAVKNNRKVVQQIQGGGTSGASKINREELRQINDTHAAQKWNRGQAPTFDVE